MAYKKVRAKIGTHSSEIIYLYQCQKLKIGNIIFAATQSNFENSKPFQRVIPDGSFGNNIFKRYRVDDINKSIVFLSFP